MIRVLWERPNVSAWTGGLNYFRNLCQAIYSLPGRTVEPMILGSAEGLPSPLCQAPAIPMYSKPPEMLRDFRYVRNLLEGVMLGRGKDYERYLRRHGIQLFSHGAIPSSPTNIPFLAWIPDFQQRHLPQFFSPQEIGMRNRSHARLAKVAQGILLSSEDARQDFNRFHPGHEKKTKVLHFVSIPPSVMEMPPAAHVLNKYNIDEPFLHVPNQLWAHKNHEIILNALCLLKKRGCCPLVVSTGQVEDHRNPDYFKQLYRRVKNAGMGERYRFLGLVDYKEACVLMRSSVALINPSLFEGWSTTVEEAKSLGKRMLLSALPVHREQAPARSAFFDPRNAEQLAFLMEEALAIHDPSQDQRAMQAAEEALSGRIQTFGKEYENIVQEMVK